jgi:hypothetical protein
MTVAEYVTTFVAIIVSLAVADLLISLHRLLRAGSRVRWHWIPAALALYALLLAVNFWWGNYSRFVHLKRVAMVEFLPTLTSLVILFLILAAVLPDEIPAGGLDLKKWYEDNARYIWLLNVVGLGMVLTVFAVTHVRTGPDVIQYLGDQSLNLALIIGAILLLFVKRLWVHGTYVAFAVLVLVYGSLVRVIS